MVGLIVKNNDPRLLAHHTAVGDTTTSPFVIAITNAGVHGLDSVFNAVILLACFEVSNSAVYASTRTMAALAEQRQAPAMLAYIDRHGRPVAAILVALIVGLLSYLGSSRTASQIEVLTWFTSLSGLSGLFTWGSICLCHIQFRRAWKYQGHSLDELAFKSAVGIPGSVFGLVCYVILLILQLWIAIAPIGFEDMTPTERVTNFFQSYLTIPIVIVFYVGYKLTRRSSVVRPDNMNLSIGILTLTLEQIREEERAKRLGRPWWKPRFYMPNYKQYFSTGKRTQVDDEWDYPIRGNTTSSK